MKTLKRICFYVLAVLSYVLVIVAAVLFSGLLTLFQPDGTLFITKGDWWLPAMSLLILGAGFPLTVFWEWVFRRDGFYDPSGGFARFVRRHLWAFLALVFVLLYVLFTDVTYVTRDNICHRTPFDPVGTTYSYTDVAGVDTGFYSRRQGLIHARKGDFYYVARMKDGTIIDLSEALVIHDQQYEDYDSYQEIVELDAALMREGVPKIAAPDGVEYSSLDERYAKMLSNIVANA